MSFQLTYFHKYYTFNQLVMDVKKSFDMFGNSICDLKIQQYVSSTIKLQRIVLQTKHNKFYIAFKLKRKT